MATARRELVDPNVTRWYHCISTCVRAQHLLGGDKGTERKAWIEKRLETLSESFSIATGGFACLDNHLHVLCRLDPEEAKTWSNEEVMRRWINIYPPKTLKLDDKAIVDSWIKKHAQDRKRIKKLRKRLTNLGWFMKALKEPLARKINKEEGERGSLWQPRFKSIAILDDAAMLTTSIYIDLNIVAAGIAETPETSQHTSIKQRIDHVRRAEKLHVLSAALKGSVAGSNAAGDIEQDHWLVPVEDRRSRFQGSREGMLEGFSLGSYVLLLDYVGRLWREGKAHMSDEVKDVFTRLGMSAETWPRLLKRMFASDSNLRGCFFAKEGHALSVSIGTKERRVMNLSPQVTA